MIKIELDGLDETIKKLINSARDAQANAYAPYSNYFVGSAVLDSSGNIYNGCNVENAAYTGTHAEAAAIAAMVAAGSKSIAAIVCITKDGGSSCGDCRQRIWEFCAGDKELPIYLVNDEGDINQTTIGELLPFAFEL